MQPITDPAASPYLQEGIDLFNRGKHWHAHEAWEQLWMGLEGDDKVYVQGLIMAAAMLVQYGKRIERGVENHFANALARLDRGLPEKWGIDTAALVAALEPFCDDAASGTWSLHADHVGITRNFPKSAHKGQ